jgi:hypothetical protein
MVLHVLWEWGNGESFIITLTKSCWFVEFSNSVVWGGMGITRASQGPLSWMVELVWETFFFYLEHGPHLFVVNYLDRTQSTYF